MYVFILKIYIYNDVQQHILFSWTSLYVVAFKKEIKHS